MQRRNFIYLSRLGYGPLEFKSGGFACIWQSKWVGIIVIKTERTKIHFWVTFSLPSRRLILRSIIAWSRARRDKEITERVCETPLQGTFWYILSFVILTREPVFLEVGLVVDGLTCVKRCLQTLPFYLPAGFCSIAFSLFTRRVGNTAGVSKHIRLETESNLRLKLCNMHIVHLFIGWITLYVFIVSKIKKRDGTDKALILIVLVKVA